PSLSHYTYIVTLFRGPIKDASASGQSVQKIGWEVIGRSFYAERNRKGHPAKMGRCPETPALRPSRPRGNNKDFPFPSIHRLPGDPEEHLDQALCFLYQSAFPFLSFEYPRSKAPQHLDCSQNIHLLPHISMQVSGCPMR